EDLGQLLGHRVEVRDQQLHAGAGDGRVDLAHGLGVEPRAAVGQVVAGDAGDGGVAQAHRGHRLGHPARLVPVEVGRLAGVDLAEVAAPGALLAADQEGRLAVFPALEDVGAAGLLADGVQAFVGHQLPQRGVLRAHLGPGLDPGRLLLDRGLAVADLEAKQLSAFWAHRRHRNTSPRSSDTNKPNGAQAAAGTGSAGAGFVRTRSVAAPLGSVSRCRWRSTTAAASSTVTSRPSSRLSVVTPASEMPQGMIRWVQPRSFSQLSAKPCMVTPWAKRRPSAATLRSCSVSSFARTHTPERPLTRSVARPRSAHASMMTCSSRRTKSTTYTPSGRRTIG